LHDWNEHVVKAKLDDFQVNYFIKQKKNRAKEEGISTIMKGREGKESGARSGRNNQCTPHLQKTLIVF
jgi:hypothetical protein